MTVVLTAETLDRKPVNKGISVVGRPRGSQRLYTFAHRNVKSPFEYPTPISTRF